MAIDAAKQKQMERWAQTRQLGRGRFILVYGVLFWGVLVAIFWSLWMSWGQGWSRFWYYLAFAIVGFPIGGYFWGAWMWKLGESSFLASQAASEEEVATNIDAK